jgi:hypothetical protein
MMTKWCSWGLLAAPVVFLMRHRLTSEVYPLLQSREQLCILLNAIMDLFSRLSWEKIEKYLYLAGPCQDRISLDFSSFTQR